MSKKVRFIYRYFGAVLRKQWHKFGIVIILFLIFTSLIGFLTNFLGDSLNILSAKTIKPIFREGLVGTPTTFNPLFSRSEVEKEINNLVFRGLTKISATGSIVPDLAESIEVKESAEYLFKLRKDINWHDGRKFTAEDVIHTIKIAQDSLYDSVAAENFRDVEVKKLDNHTVSFKLKEPFAPFLSTTTLGIIPAHIPLTDYRPIGTGGFRFNKIEKESVILENDKFRLKLQFYPTEDTAILALKMGEIHSLALSSNRLKEVAEWRNYQVETPVLPYRLVTLFYNTKETPLNSKDIRQALTYALNKDQIAKSESGNKGKIASNSYALLATLQAGTKEKFSFNLEKSNQLLTSEGWELKEGKRIKDGKQLSFTITTLADEEFEDSAKKIKASWEKLGIEVNITAVSGTELKDQIVPKRSYNVLLSTLLLSPDPDQYVVWHTTQSLEGNVSGISSPKLDKLLEDARRTLDPKIRNEKYVEFSKHLLDESPASFLYYPNYTWIYSNRLEKVNFAEFSEPSDRFRSASDWFIKRPLF